MDHIQSCKCGSVIVKSRGNELKIRNKMLVLKSGRAYAVCPDCNHEVEVPVLLNAPMVKSLQDSARNPPLYVGNKRS